MHRSHPSPFMGSYISGSQICRVGPRIFKQIPVQSVRGKRESNSSQFLFFLQRKEILTNKSKPVAK